MKRSVLVLLFVTWWLNQVMSVLSFASNLFPDVYDVNRLRHVAAASLVGAYEDYRAPARPRQRGHRIDPDLLDSMSDEEARYYFR
jgi:hypothetical protein